MSSPRISEDTAEKVIGRAVKRYAQSKQISIDDLMTAGKAANIPAEFIEQALQEIIVHKPHKQNSMNWKKCGEAICQVGILATLFSGIVFGFQMLRSNRDAKINPFIKGLLYSSPLVVAGGYVLQQTATRESYPVELQALQDRLAVLESAVANLKWQLSTEKESSDYKWEKVMALTKTVEELTERVSSAETNLIENALTTLSIEGQLQQKLEE